MTSLHGDPIRPGEDCKLSLIENGSEVGFITVAWKSSDLPNDLQVIVSRIDESACGHARMVVV